MIACGGHCCQAPVRYLQPSCCFKLGTDDLQWKQTKVQNCLPGLHCSLHSCAVWSVLLLLGRGTQLSRRPRLSIRARVGIDEAISDKKSLHSPRKEHRRCRERCTCCLRASWVVDCQQTVKGNNGSISFQQQQTLPVLCADAYLLITATGHLIHFVRSIGCNEPSQMQQRWYTDSVNCGGLAFGLNHLLSFDCSWAHNKQLRVLSSCWH